MPKRHAITCLSKMFLTAVYTFEQLLNDMFYDNDETDCNKWQSFTFSHKKMVYITNKQNQYLFSREFLYLFVHLWNR